MNDLVQPLADNLFANKDTDDEISLIGLFVVLWRRKAVIIAVTIVAALGAVAFSVLSLVLPPETSPLPNEYTPTALMLINGPSSQGGGSDAARACGGLRPAGNAA